MSSSKVHSREAERIRNIGIVAHIDAGKTTLTERILYETKEIRTMGEVHDGTTVTDFLPEERERGISITAAAVSCRWKSWQINILDTPGHIDFTGEVERSLAVMDGAVLLLCAVKGVQAQTETVWRRAVKHRLPALAFINKMDREGADGTRVIDQLANRLGIVPLPLQYPVMEQDIFLGTVDLLSGRTSVSGPAGRQAMESAGCAQARQNLLERLGENDDSILHDYVAGVWPTETALKRAIRRATVNRRVVPVLFGSSLQDTGVSELLDAVGSYLPSPFDRGLELPDGCCGLRVFKTQESLDGTGRTACVRVLGATLTCGQTLVLPRTGEAYAVSGIYRIQAGQFEPVSSASFGEVVAVTGDWGTKLRTGDLLVTEGAELPPVRQRLSFPQPVVSIIMEAADSAEAARLAAVLRETGRDDPTLRISPVPGTQSWNVSGLGELHLEVLRNRLLTEHGLETRAGQPRVEYRTTLLAAAEDEGRFERHLLTGETLAASVKVAATPLERGAGMHIEASPAVRALPSEQRKAVLQGILNVVNAESSGFPLTDARVTVLSASVHAGEASEAVLLSAARTALANLLVKAGTCVLEPVMRLEVLTPQDTVGGVIADLNVRKAEILQVESLANGVDRLDALVPLAELLGYASRLRSLSAGRGEVVAEPAQYRPRATH